MRKIFLLLLSVIMLAMSSSYCDAAFSKRNPAYDRSLSDSAIALGGVTFGMRIADVKSIYGEPTKVTEPRDDQIRGGKKFSYIYGDTFEVYFSDGYVCCVETTANNGISTPADIHVGDVKEKIVMTYGNPWYYAQLKDGKEIYSYRSKSYAAIRFDVYNGKIVRIYIVDME